MVADVLTMFAEEMFADDETEVARDTNSWKCLGQGSVTLHALQTKKLSSNRYV